MANKKHIVISILGTRKDRATPEMNGWTPSLSLVQHEDQFKVDEYHLVYNKGFKALAEEVQSRIEELSVATNVILDEIPLKDPWDFDEVSLQFYNYV